MIEKRAGYLEPAHWRNAHEERRAGESLAGSIMKADGFELDDPLLHTVVFAVDFGRMFCIPDSYVARGAFFLLQELRQGARLLLPFGRGVFIAVLRLPCFVVLKERQKEHRHLAEKLDEPLDSE